MAALPRGNPLWPPSAGAIPCGRLPQGRSLVAALRRGDPSWPPSPGAIPCGRLPQGRSLVAAFPRGDPLWPPSPGAIPCGRLPQGRSLVAALRRGDPSWPPSPGAIPCGRPPQGRSLVAARRRGDPSWAPSPGAIPCGRLPRRGVLPPEGEGTFLPLPPSARPLHKCLATLYRPPIFRWTKMRIGVIGPALRGQLGFMQRSRLRGKIEMGVFPRDPTHPTPQI